MKRHHSVPSILRVAAPCKINWVLTIAGRRDDGYHDIDTVMQTLNWCDELICRPIRQRKCRIRCGYPGVPTDKSNLVVQAWQRLAETFGAQVGGVEVELIKRIPPGAGLGGGSSDATAMLLAVRRIFDLPLNRRELETHAAALGSDCAFFVRGGCALASGRGERLEPVENRLPEVNLVVVWPGFSTSTARAYGGVRPAHFQDGSLARRAATAIQAGNLSKLQKTKWNVFDKIIVDSADKKWYLIQN